MNKQTYLKLKLEALKGRYITIADIEPILNKLKLDTEVLGESVEGLPIYGYKLGCGHTRILLWSQMHGNETTTTKAVLDLTNILLQNNSDLLNGLTLFIIPILNPDGAKAYKRYNANEVDLNRDAVNLSQPESIILRDQFNAFKPHFCFNLHGQRTIFGVDGFNTSAVVSFLAPAFNDEKAVDGNRAKAMSLVSEMNDELQTVIPNQIGLYDDGFNINCVGDTFQNLNVPTVLFEAGHYKQDYEREETRFFIVLALFKAINVVKPVLNETISRVNDYYQIPRNIKNHVDILIKNALVNNKKANLEFKFREVLKSGKVQFVPTLSLINSDTTSLSHKTIDAKNKAVTAINTDNIVVDSEYSQIKIGEDIINLTP